MTPYICLDIETIEGQPEDANAWMRLHWNPDKRWSNETVGKRYHEMLAKKIERLSLLDTSPILIISWRSDQHLFVLLMMTEHEPEQRDQAVVQGFPDQASMLASLGSLMGLWCDEETILVGHHIKGFDLPKLRWAFIRHQIPLPHVLAAKDQPIYDTMREYCARFSLDDKIMIGLHDLLTTFGLPSHKEIVEGSQVSELYEAGEHDVLIQYAILDVLTEADLFLRMTGQPTGANYVSNGATPAAAAAPA